MRAADHLPDRFNAAAWFVGRHAARQDGDGLVKAHAFVSLRQGTGADGLPETLRVFARERLEAYKCPRWVTVVPELPKTATGKIQRFRLREAAAGGPVREAAEGAPD